MKPAYYNEFDKGAAAWLRELIKAGLIADGDVDERSIEDVLPGDLKGYSQCHFFAGIGVWSYALRKAGWSDDRPIWTGSCPCQPFSAAGKGTAFDDERHLWPAFHHLIKECRPEQIIGEQVASKDADAWLDLVQDDMEGLGYAFGAVAFPSAGVGAPHIRDRTYWVADSKLSAKSRHGFVGIPSVRKQETKGFAGNGVANQLAGFHGNSGVFCEEQINFVGRLANSNQDGCKSRGGVRPVCGEHDSEYVCGKGRMDNAVGIGRGTRRNDDTQHDGQQLDAARNANRPNATNSFWRDADWLFCRDGKWRPVEPGTFPLVNGVAKGVVHSCSDGLPIDANKTGEARVIRLRGYGNAINAIAAQVFIESIMEIAA